MSKTKKNPGANWCQTRATVKQIRLPIPAQHTVLPFSARPGQSVRQKTNRNVPGTSCHLGRKKQLEGPSHLHIQLCLLRSKVGVAVTRPGKSHTCNVITLHPPLRPFGRCDAPKSESALIECCQVHLSATFSPLALSEVTALHREQFFKNIYSLFERESISRGRRREELKRTPC